MKKKSLVIFIILFFSIATPTVFGAGKSPTVAELQKKITSLTQQVKALTTKLSIKTKEADKFKKENSSIKKTKINLESAVELKKDEIEWLNEDLKDKDKEIGKLNELLRAKVVYTDINANVVSEGPTAIKWYLFQTQQTDIYLTREAYDSIGYIVEISDILFRDVASYFNVSQAPSKVSVFISLEKFNNTDSARYEGRDDRIYITASHFAPFNGRNTESVPGTYIHEITHAFQELLNFANFDKYWDHRWFIEGLAMYINRQYVDYKQYVPESHVGINMYGQAKYKDMISNALSCSNINLTSIESISKSEQCGYDIYESIVYYMHQKYGKQAVIKFAEEYRNKDISASLSNSFGVSEEQFLKDWKNYFSLN